MTFSASIKLPIFMSTDRSNWQSGAERLTADNGASFSFSTDWQHRQTLNNPEPQSKEQSGEVPQKKTIILTTCRTYRPTGSVCKLLQRASAASASKVTFKGCLLLKLNSQDLRFTEFRSQGSEFVGLGFQFLVAPPRTGAFMLSEKQIGSSCFEG